MFGIRKTKIDKHSAPNITRNDDACVATKMGAKVRYVSAPVKASQAPQVPSANCWRSSQPVECRLCIIMKPKQAKGEILKVNQENMMRS